MNFPKRDIPVDKCLTERTKQYLKTIIKLFCLQVQLIKIPNGKMTCRNVKIAGLDGNFLNLFLLYLNLFQYVHKTMHFISELRVFMKCNRDLFI